MKVREMMTSDVKTCRPETNLAEAVRDMWEGDCGALPVVNDEGRVTSMITDPTGTSRWDASPDTARSDDPDRAIPAYRAASIRAALRP